MRGLQESAKGRESRTGISLKKTLPCAVSCTPPPTTGKEVGAPPVTVSQARGPRGGAPAPELSKARGCGWSHPVTESKESTLCVAGPSGPVWGQGLKWASPGGELGLGHLERDPSHEETSGEGTMVGGQPAGFPMSTRDLPQVRDPQRRGLPHPHEGPQQQVQGTHPGHLSGPCLSWTLLELGAGETRQGLEHQRTAPWKHLHPTRRGLCPESRGWTSGECPGVCDYGARLHKRSPGHVGEYVREQLGQEE